MVKFLPIALFIGLQACVLQILDQLITSGEFKKILTGGGGWIAFQAWAMYFLSGCNIKGGLRTFVGYAIGVLASIAIIFISTELSGSLKFMATPLVLLVLVPFIIYLEKAPSIMNYVPAIFVGSGVYFGIMTYVKDAQFHTAALSELFFCCLGLCFGWMTVTFRGWYEKKVKI